MDTSKPFAVELLDEAHCTALETVLVDHIEAFNARTTGHVDAKLLGGSIRAGSERESFSSSAAELACEWLGSEHDDAD